MSQKPQSCMMGLFGDLTVAMKWNGAHKLELVIPALVEFHLSLTFCGTCHSASSGRLPFSGFTPDGFLARSAFCMKRNPRVPLLNVFDIREEE